MSVTGTAVWPDHIAFTTVNVAVHNVNKLSSPPQIYPNPATTSIVIDPLDNKELNIKINSTEGRLINSFKMTEKKTVDISHLPSGVYFIIAENKGTRSTFKLLKL